MADLVVAKDDLRQNGELVSVKLANVRVFKGANLNFNVAGFAKKASDTAAETFAGVAMETVDNSAGAAGAAEVRVWRRGVSSMACTGATQAWVGQKVCAVDDNVVALAATTTNDVLVGTVVSFVSATEVRVAYQA